MKDFNPVDCKTYSGKVLEVRGGEATVETRLGKRNYKTTFMRDAAKEDEVIVHWDFIVERVPPAFSKRMHSANP